MPEQYYINNDKIKEGPFSIEQLKSKKVDEKTLVWTNDMADWQLASSIEELRTIVKRSPLQPPLTPYEKLASKKNNHFLTAAKTCFLYLLLITFGSFICMGGFTSDQYLINLYTSGKQNIVWSYPADIRFPLLPLVSLIFIALPLSIMILFFKYKVAVAKLENNYNVVNKSIRQALYIVLIIPIILLVITFIDVDSNDMKFNIVNYTLLYLPLTILILSIFVFYYTTHTNKLKTK